MTAPVATLGDKVGLGGIALRAVGVALVRLFTSPFRNSPRNESLFRDIGYAMLRAVLGPTNIAQDNMVVAASTESTYLDYAKLRGFQPDTLVLPSGCKAHWIGNKGASKVLMILHGGGYVLKASPAVTSFYGDLVLSLAKKQSVSGVLLGYTTAPEATYPGQLRQAVELLHHLLVNEGRKASDIVLVGDSAGGNLALALLSHMLHPHPDIAQHIEVSEALAGLVAISPWSRFESGDASFERNKELDIITPSMLKRWSSAWLGGAPLDSYNYPVSADPTWYRGLDTKVRDILIWGGGGEVLIDSIGELAGKLKDAQPRTDYVIEPGACHEVDIFDVMLGYKQGRQMTELVESWISSRL